jgi:hypothetical protein
MLHLEGTNAHDRRCALTRGIGPKSVRFSNGKGTEGEGQVVIESFDGVQYNA